MTLAESETVAGRYRLLEVIGRGGMGEVWRGRDELIDREVAVKRLLPPAALDSDERGVFRQRALAEARNAGRINHPGVVSVYDIVPGEGDDDAVHVVMELVRGPTLLEVIKRDGRLSAERVADVAVRLARALEAAHALHVVHRDVKPGNVHLLSDGGVKLVDFGIAQALMDPRLTPTTGVMGTDSYMCPEAYEGSSPAPAWDWWSLGVTLYEALDGVNLFQENNMAATVRAILWRAIPSPDCQPPLSTVLAGLLERQPDRRLTGADVASLLASARPVDGEPGSPGAALAPEVPRTRRWPNGPTQEQSANDEPVLSEEDAAAVSSQGKESPSEVVTFECRSKPSVGDGTAYGFLTLACAAGLLSGGAFLLLEPPDAPHPVVSLVLGVASGFLGVTFAIFARHSFVDLCTTRVRLSAAGLHVSTENHLSDQTYDAWLKWSDIDKVAVNSKGEVLLTVPSMTAKDKNGVSYRAGGAVAFRIDELICLGIRARIEPSGQRLCEAIEHHSGLKTARA